MRVLIDNQPFQFQPPNNAQSAWRLCQQLIAAGVTLKPSVARCQTGPVPRAVESEARKLLNDRSPEGRLAFIRWLCAGRVELAPANDPDVSQQQEANGINLLINGQPVIVPPIRTLRQVFLVCGILRQAGFRIKPVHGNPPFASSRGERRQVMKMLVTSATPDGARRLVEWLVDATDVRVA